MSNRDTRARRAKLKAAQQRHERSKNWKNKIPKVQIKTDSNGDTIKITRQKNGDVLVEKVDEPRRTESAE